MIEQINSFIDSLSLDHKRGAAEIVADTSQVIIEIANLADDNEVSAGHLFERAIKRLAKGQPTMAPVLNLLNRVCVIKEKAGDDWSEFENLFAAIVRQPDDYLDRMKSQIDRIPRAENTLIAFSNSSTVAQVIIAASKAANWPRRVFCSESRPVMEGIVLARKLTAAGLDVTLFTDAALMSRVVEADAVWVGGDSLSREGLVNKVGSRALAMLCKFQGIPFVSLMGSDKLLPTALTPYFHFLPQNPREIGADEADGLNIHNEYYEVIPLELVSHIVTEDGVHSPHELISTIENEPLSPLFERILGS